MSHPLCHNEPKNMNPDQNQSDMQFDDSTPRPALDSTTQPGNDSRTQPPTDSTIQLVNGSRPQAPKDSTLCPETDPQAFARLGGLSPAQYDRLRHAEAKRLQIRLETLDAEVAQARTELGYDAEARAVKLPPVEPWPEPVRRGQSYNCDKQSA